MPAYLWIALGGALGSVGRYWLADSMAARFGDKFPWGTLLINVSGSFAIGLFFALTAADGRWPASLSVRQFFMVGICGGFTTFSAFSLQTLHLMQAGDWLRAGAYIVGSVVLCLLAVWLGHLLAISLNAKGA